MSEPLRGLIVDDSVVSAKMMRLLLLDIDCEAKIVTRLKDFKGAFIDHRPHFVLSDLFLPDSGGQNICTLLREQLGAGATPIWLMSGLHERELREHPLAKGADGYLSKSSEPEEFKTRLYEMIRALARDG
jgi:DNA-binding response OmpR family regulator